MTKPRLLLADDSVTIRKVIELTFADEGIDVTTVADGEGAMSKFVEIHPDIVLVDVGLPGTDGYHICEMIKGDETTSHIPVLLLVGSFEPFDQDAAERSGADGFLTKPFHSIRDLVNRVHELLGTHDQSPLDIGDITFGTTSATSDTEDIEDLYEQSFAETVQIEHPAASATAQDLDTTPAEEPESEAQDAPPVDESHHSVEQWLDDEMIETVGTNAPEDTYEESSDESKPEEEAVEAVAQYEDAPASAVDIEPIKEFDWSPAAIVTAADEREMGAAAGFSPAFISEEPFLELSGSRHDDVTADYPKIEEPKISDGDGTDVDSIEQDNIDVEETRSEPEAPVQTNDHADIPLDNDREDVLVRETANELVEVIVRRVIDRLSEKAIRDVAQEAVPRIAEKLMREALEEERQKNS